MSINDLTAQLSRYNLLILLFFIFIPLAAFTLGKIAPKKMGETTPLKYVYSVLLYLSSVPGMFSSVLTAYALFILRSNLLNVNIVIYIVPIISMIITMVLVSRSVDLDRVPGFERILGLFIVLAVTFTITLAMLQTRIFIFFGSSIKALIVFVVILFLLLNWGAGKLFRSKEKEPDL